MLKPAPLLTLCSVIITASFLSSSAQSATDTPDFTGVWLAFSSQPSTPRGAPSPLSAAGEAAVNEYLGQYGDNFVEPGSYCVPPGMPSTMTSVVGYPIEIIHSENRITMLAEIEMQVRRIFMDGRDHPSNYPDSRMGHSTGHWDDNALIIDTQLLKENLGRRSPRTQNTQIVETVSMVKRADIDVRPNGFIITPAINDNVLVFDMVVTDATLYKEPQHVITYYQQIEDDSILEYDCAAELWQQALEAAAE